MDKEDRDLSEVPQHFGHQILLYAKHWYAKSDDGVMADLKTLLSEYIGQEAIERDVREILANTFGEYCPRYLKGRAIQEMLGWGWLCHTNPRKPEEVMIGALAVADGKYVDPTQLLPVLVKEKNDNDKLLQN